MTEEEFKAEYARLKELNKFTFARFWRGWIRSLLPWCAFGGVAVWRWNSDTDVGSVVWALVASVGRLAMIAGHACWSVSRKEGRDARQHRTEEAFKFMRLAAICLFAAFVLLRISVRRYF